MRAITQSWKQPLAALANGVSLTRAAPWVTFALLALVCWQAAVLTWALLPTPQQPAPPVAANTSVTPVASAADALTLSRTIAARHLFGSTVSTAAPVAQTNIPETRLRLTLRGVMAASLADQATAIIADPAGNENYYPVGAELPGGATLEEVHAEHVVLSRNGRYETLSLPKNALDVAGTTRTSARQPAFSSRPAARPPQPAPNAGALLRDMRQRIAQNPAALGELFQGQPVSEGGRMIGFRLSGGANATTLRQFGLQPGDVVTAVNGVGLDDPAGRLELLRNIGNAGQVTVEIQRNGTPYAFTINAAR